MIDQRLQICLETVILLKLFKFHYCSLIGLFRTK
jgi:hypothetical protein